MAPEPSARLPQNRSVGFAPLVVHAPALERGGEFGAAPPGDHAAELEPNAARGVHVGDPRVERAVGVGAEQAGEETFGSKQSAALRPSNVHRILPSLERREELEPLHALHRLTEHQPLPPYVLHVHGPIVKRNRHVKQPPSPRGFSDRSFQPATLAGETRPRVERSRDRSKRPAPDHALRPDARLVLTPRLGLLLVLSLAHATHEGVVQLPCLKRSGSIVFEHATAEEALRALHRAHHPPVLGDLIPPRDERVAQVDATPLAHVPGQRAAHVDASGGGVNPTGESRRRRLLRPPPGHDLRASLDRPRRGFIDEEVSPPLERGVGDDGSHPVDETHENEPFSIRPRDGVAPIVERYRERQPPPSPGDGGGGPSQPFDLARVFRERGERGRDGSVREPTRDPFHLGEPGVLGPRRIRRVDPGGERRGDFDAAHAVHDSAQDRPVRHERVHPLDPIVERRR